MSRAEQDQRAAAPAMQVDTPSGDATLQRREATEAPLAAPSFEWNDKWCAESMQLAFEEAKGLQERYADWLKAVEAKVVTIFTVSSAALTVAATVRSSQPTRFALVVWAAALIAYAAAIAFCLRAYQVRRFRQDLDPTEMLRSPDYLTLTADQYRVVRLRDIGLASDRNRALIADIGRNVGRALLCAAMEIGLIALALVMTT